MAFGVDMDKWIKESRRIRAGVNPMPDGWPFHLRPYLKSEYDRLMAEHRRAYSDAMAIKDKALGIQ